MDDIVVIKCGGSTIASLTDDFFASVNDLRKQGKKPIIVHGGGPSIKHLLDALQIESEFVDSLRNTTDEVMNVVEMVLCGKLSNLLVRGLQRSGVTAIGLTGCDGELLQAKAKDKTKFGLVGEITDVNEELLFRMLEMDIVPVIAPVAIGLDGEERYNVNADTAAGAVAAAVSAKQLLFVTDVPGVLNGEQLIKHATTTEILSLIDSGVITGGMIPKVKAAIDSLKGDLTEVVIVSGQERLMNDSQIVGTTIKKPLEAVK